MDSQVSDIMNQQPITLSSSAQLADARQLMANHNIRHLPIVDHQQRLVGLVSQRDILAASQPHHIGEPLASNPQEQQGISRVMSRDVLSVSPQMTVRCAAETLSRNHIGCLPVVDDAQLVGIVTGSDFINVAINLLQLLDDESVLD